MMNAGTIQYVEMTLNQCGVNLPPKAQTARAVLEALQNEGVRDVVAEAIAAADSSPLTAKNAGDRVQKLATALIARERAAEAARHYEPVVLEQIRSAIVKESVALIDSLRPMFDNAADAMHRAALELDPYRTPTVHDGPEAVRLYEQMTDASVQLNAVRSAYISVRGLNGYAEPDVSWFIEQAPDVEALGYARVAFRQGWDRLVHQGFRLRLNLPAEAAEVIADAERADAARSAARLEARRAAVKDPLREAAIARLLEPQEVSA